MGTQAMASPVDLSFYSVRMPSMCTQVLQRRSVPMEALETGPVIRLSQPWAEQESTHGKAVIYYNPDVEWVAQSHTSGFPPNKQTAGT